MRQTQQPPPDELVIWGHVVKGLEGCLNMAERCLPWAGRLGKDRAKELHGLKDRMDELVREFDAAHGKEQPQQETPPEQPDTDTYVG